MPPSYRRPGPLTAQVPAPAGPDDTPGVRAELGEDIAEALLTVGRTDPQEALARAEGIGLAELTTFWQDSEPTSPAGVLLRLHLLRTWLWFRAEDAARVLAAGRLGAPVEDVVAGLSELPGTDELGALGERLLLAAYGGDLSGAARRGAALLAIVAAGGDGAAERRAREASAGLVSAATALAHRSP